MCIKGSCKEGGSDIVQQAVPPLCGAERGKIRG